MIPSSCNHFHSWPLLSNNSIILCIVCAIFFVDFIASFSLCTLTYGEVVGIVCSSNSFIWYLYYSKACTIFLIFSSEYTSSDSALFGKVSNSVPMYFSIYSNFCCAIIFSWLSWLTYYFNEMFSSWDIYRFFTSDLSLAWISLPTLICNFYNAFVGILENSKSNIFISFRGFVLPHHQYKTYQVFILCTVFLLSWDASPHWTFCFVLLLARTIYACLLHGDYYVMRLSIYFWHFLWN